MRRLFLTSILLAMLAMGLPAYTASAAPIPASSDYAAIHPGEHPTLKRGSTGTYVRELQTLLNTWIRANPGQKLAPLAVNGTFGPQTETVVRAYQKAKGLPVTGVVGPQTWNSLLGTSSTPASTGKVYVKNDTSSTLRITLTGPTAGNWSVAAGKSLTLTIKTGSYTLKATASCGTKTDTFSVTKGVQKDFRYYCITR